ncbi:conserved protein of unknown function [Tenacibaculum sp. 190130A14a]|uniref:Lipoprotein n=1 Tax=Tenacibaculum polynesiense TaxID=3137857 RepID=A0ABM9PD43_9FLAO
MRKLTLILITLTIIASCKVVEITDIEKRYLISGKGNNKFYLIDFIKENQDNEKLGEIPSVILNGEVITYHYKEEHEKILITKKEIKRIEIMESKKSIPLYGSAGKYGVIMIYTY